ncbi:MAG: nucleotidyl transferase AbiEii/AbiGii toxin family protein [bacterium]
MTELFYGEVFRKLKEQKINYLVVGGIAVALHGAPRFTADADFALQLVPDNIERFLRALKQLGYEPKVPVNAQDLADPKKRAGWIKDKGMTVLSFWNTNDPLKLIDVFVANPIDFQEMANEQLVKTAAGIEIPIPSLRHLIKLKMIAGRPQDLRDIELLEKLNGKD